MVLTEYRGNFFFWMTVSTMWSVFNLFFVGLLVGINGSIAGWEKPEMYVLLATYTLVDAAIWGFFYTNMYTYSNSVFNGDLNVLLTKPINAQFWVMTNKNNYSEIMRLFLGIAVLVWAVISGGFTISLASVAGYIFFFINSLLFIYFLWFCLTTLSFWVERLDNINEIIPNLRRVYQVPSQVYTGIASTLFTVIIPLGLVTTIPSEFLLGSVTSWKTSLYFFAFTVTLIVFSRWFFKRSLQRYSGIAN